MVRSLLTPSSDPFFIDYSANAVADQVEFKKCLCTGKGMRDALAAGNMKNCEDKKEQETFANGICKGVDGFQPVKF